MRNLRLILALVLVPAALWAQGSTFSNHWLDQLPITTNASFKPTRQDQWRGGCGAFSVLGTFDSATVTFEASFDDTNFFTVNDTGGAPIAPTVATENVQFCLPFAYIRVTIAGGGGSLSITQMGVASMGDTVALWLGSGGVVTTDTINAAGGLLSLQTVGVTRYQLSGNTFFGVQPTGPSFLNEPASCTNPTLIPNRGNLNHGWGGVVGGGNDALCGILGGVQEFKVGVGFVEIAGVLAGDNQAVTLGVAADTYAATTNWSTLTGDGGANTVATITGGVAGQALRILFVDSLVTITDTDAHTADTVDLSAAFTSADDTVLTLLSDGTSWYESSRSVN